jgi:hypothetical protein
MNSHFLSRLCTGISIKRGGLILVYGSKSPYHDINVRENRICNQEWTLQTHRQHKGTQDEHKQGKKSLLWALRILPRIQTEVNPCVREEQTVYNLYKRWVLSSEIICGKVLIVSLIDLWYPVLYVICHLLIICLKIQLILIYLTLLCFLKIL